MKSDISPLGHERLYIDTFQVNFNISMKMLVFFLAKYVRNAVKTMVVDRKNQKALALLYLASKPLQKAANSSGVPTEFKRTDKANLNFSPELYRLICFA